MFSIKRQPRPYWSNSIQGIVPVSAFHELKTALRKVKRYERGRSYLSNIPYRRHFKIVTKGKCTFGFDKAWKNVEMDCWLREKDRTFLLRLAFWKDPKFKHFSWRKCNLSSISKQTVPFFRRNFAFHKPHALCISRISPQAGGQPKLGGKKFIRMRDKLEIAFQPFLYLCTSDNLVSWKSLNRVKSGK